MRGRWWKSGALALVAAGVLAIGGGSAAATVPGGNLLQNPGAEAGIGSTDSSCGSGGTTPGWNATSGFTAVQYGTSGYPDQTVSSEIGGGSNFFTGGCTSGADAGQTIDLTPYTSDIDMGHIQLTLSGYLGGYLTQEDNAQVRVDFIAGDSNLGHVTIGPVTAADRNNQTTLLLRQAQAMIPPGTRTLNVDLKFSRVTGMDDDGTADNIAVALTDTSMPPAPSNISPPVISGEATVGHTVACSTGTWTNNPTSYAFQWLLDGRPLSGEASSTHIIASDEAGHQLACQVTATNPTGSNAATSGGVTVGHISPPTNKALPRITVVKRPAGQRSSHLPPGKVTAGTTLSCTRGEWTGNPTSYQYGWFASSGARSPVLRRPIHIGGSAFNIPTRFATGQTVDVPDLPAGTRLECGVTASNAGGSTIAGSQDAALVALKPLVARKCSRGRRLVTACGPSITRGVGFGGVNGCLPGTWTHHPTRFRYTWLIDPPTHPGDKPARIVGSGQWLAITGDEEGHVLVCRVKASNAAGATDALSNSYKIKLGAPRTHGSPVITDLKSGEKHPGAHRSDPLIADQFDLGCSAPAFNQPNVSVSFVWELELEQGGESTRDFMLVVPGVNLRGDMNASWLWLQAEPIEYAQEHGGGPNEVVPFSGGGYNTDPARPGGNLLEDATFLDDNLLAGELTCIVDAVGPRGETVLRSASLFFKSADPLAANVTP